MNPGDERTGLPPRSHSLNISNNGARTPAPLVDAFDLPLDGNDEKKRSDDLVVEAQEALQLVDGGWDPKELCPVVPKLVDRVRQLTSALVQLQDKQAELETSLLLTKSNLTLALSNTEMLEEALQRADIMKGKDVGWRRWSDREGLLKRSQASVSNLPADYSTISRGRISEDGSESSKRHTYQGAHEKASSDSDRRVPRRSQSAMPSPNTPSSSPPVSSPTAPPSRNPTPTPPPAGDGGFFSRLRFGKANASSSNIVETSSSVIMSKAAGSSLPVLATSLDAISTSPEPVGDPRDILLTTEKQRTAELEKLLETERKAKVDVIAEKASIETELETLSSALFEEANKMVASERIKRAEAEEELKIANDEKEALRSALRLLEAENKASRPSVPVTLADAPSASSLPLLSKTNGPRRGAVQTRTDPPDSLNQGGPAAIITALPVKFPSHKDDSKEASPVPPLSQLTSSPPRTPTALRAADSETKLETDGQETSAVQTPSANEKPQIKATVVPSPSSPSRTKLSIPPSPSPSRHSPSNSPVSQRDPASSAVVSRTALSSRVAAARQAFEAGTGGDGTLKHVRARKTSPPLPMRIPGHVPRLPTPRGARSATVTVTSTSAKDEKI